MDNANVQPHLMRCRKALRRKQIQRRKMKSETAHDFRTSDTVAVTPRQTTVCRAEAGIDGRAEARPSEADGAVALQQGLKDYREKVSRLQEDGTAVPDLGPAPERDSGKPRRVKIGAGQGGHGWPRGSAALRSGWGGGPAIHGGLWTRRSASLRGISNTAVLPTAYAFFSVWRKTRIRSRNSAACS
jgi:hypothetical protein